MEEARLLWIQRVQSCHYNKELQSLRQGHALDRGSKFAQLHPFLDSLEVLRVGDRLENSLLSDDERNPVVLPSDSHFSRLVVQACHLRTLHSGTQLTLAMVRQRYWMPRALVKRIIRQCVTCTRWRSAAPQQLMDDLPRVTPGKPFLDVGIDYVGPVQLRTARGRGHRSYRAFIAIFVCLRTRAVHLEPMSDYTTDAFLAALRRFTSRRGLCWTIWSDCGTNFVGADTQLRRLFAASNPELQRIQGELACDGIHWRFNPSSALHFGGIWEAAVKSMKHHLRRVIGDAILTLEEMATLLSQVEACLNSRLLQAMTDDAEDLTALTPGHFLIGSVLLAVPEPSLADQPVSQLDRWRLLQRMRDHF
ncbi:uncharacterized protein LOC105255050 [Camponotus floridanus]|uniref:uncharacterized protein LOC105255050 n=1 Tax=Camponotus floridanus TaxID=104421 RepID=UPI000DC69AC5|nr:uncharacterized protein LOC105255050 [Camponotus floridanus]